MQEDRYIVHRSGIVRSDSSNYDDIMDVAILGYVHARNMEEARGLGEQIFGGPVYVAHWNNKTKRDHRLADERQQGR